MRTQVPVDHGGGGVGTHPGCAALGGGGLDAQLLGERQRVARPAGDSLHPRHQFAVRRQVGAPSGDDEALAVDSGMVSQDELDALLHPAALTRRVDAAGEGVAALGG